MELSVLLEQSIMDHASDLHLSVGISPTLRVNGKLIPMPLPQLDGETTRQLVMNLWKERIDLQRHFEEEGEVDFAYSYENKGYFRVNVYRERGNLAAALRFIPKEIPSIEKLGLPMKFIQSLLGYTSGLILITGPAGSGKSTTLASLIEYLNTTRKLHILTIEDPIEFIYENKHSMIHQREIGIDSKGYPRAIRAALREDPDVILLGEMRDLETMSTAITAAETGHLVLSTLHTMGAAATINRIVDVFPSHQQQQIRSQLANTLRGIISQQLLTRCDQESRCIAVETMHVNTAISHLIREGKTHLIYSQIQTGYLSDMKTMESSLFELYGEGKISWEQAYYYAPVKEEMHRMIKR